MEHLPQLPDSKSAEVAVGDAPDSASPTDYRFMRAMTMNTDSISNHAFEQMLRDAQIVGENVTVNPEFLL